MTRDASSRGFRNTPRSSVLLLVGLSWLVPCGVAGGEVFKWVDGHGRVHYGDAKPRGQDAQTLETAPPPTDDEVLRARSRLDGLLEHQGTTEQSQAQQATDAAAANRENETRKARCRHARRELEILKLERPVYHLDQEGNKVFLEDDKRAAELKRARGEVKSNCR